MISRKNIWRAALCLAVPLTFSACASQINAAYVDLFRNDVNVRQRNNGAADYLTQQLREFSQTGDVIRIEPLEDASNPALRTRAGTTIASQIGERLRALGYEVDLTHAAIVAGKDEYGVPQTGSLNPAYILSGTYVRKPRDLDVRVRVIETATGKTRSAFDYTLPFNHDLMREAKPAPLIFKTERP